MNMVECIIRPSKLEAVKDALFKLGIYGMTVSQVLGCGAQRGHKEVYRGVETTINLLPKIKIEIVVNDEKVNQIVEAVCAAARTGEVGDGKIFVYPITGAVRVRTGASGDNAITV